MVSLHTCYIERHREDMLERYSAEVRCFAWVAGVSSPGRLQKWRWEGMEVRWRKWRGGEQERE